MYVFRGIVSVILLCCYTAVILASILGVALPFAEFNVATLDSPEISLWQNCSLGKSNCSDLTFYCGRSRARFDTARAFGILTILVSFCNIVCCAVALAQLTCYEDVEAGVKAIRACMKFGWLTLAFSVVAMAMIVVLSVEPLCEGFVKVEDESGWKLGQGAIACAASSCFALVASCLGKILENRISTSKLGV